MTPTLNSHLEFRITRRGKEEAFIAGTRISVENVFVCHELLGRTPDEITADYPHLSLAQIYAALTYIHEHYDEVRTQFEERKKLAERSETAAPATPFTELRDRLNKNQVDHGAPLSS